MQTMEKSFWRTNPDDINMLIDIYKIFHPQELHFLLDLNKRWSKYDPNRIQNMRSILKETFSSNHEESHIEQILSYFNSENCIRLFSTVTVDMVLAERNQIFHLNPYQPVCPICSSTLIAQMADVLCVQVYTMKGKIDKATVFSVSCKHKNTVFSTSSVVHVFPNYFRQDRTITFTSKSLQNNDVVYLGGRQAFERALIENFTCQLLGKANSWQKFVDGLNLVGFNSNLTESKADWRKKLAMAFIKYKIIEFDLSIGSPKVSMPNTTNEFDEWIWKEYPRLLSAFVYLWSNHKTLVGACTAHCSQCIVVDGHQKCRRRVCRAKNVEISTEEFSSLKVGCCRTPIFGSYFCDLHQNLYDKKDNTSVSTTKKSKRNRNSTPKILGRKPRQVRFDATSCRTIKERTGKYIEKCSRSFGILAVVTNCKIIITYAEIFRSETLREIISLLCSTIRASSFSIPKCGVYDDGCHLVEFIRNHYGNDLLSTAASKFLYETKFSVDRTHFRGHVGKWCRIHMNPYNNRMLDGINTQAAEQLFSWVKGYANILSTLGWRKLPIYLLLLFHYKNLERVRIRPTQVFNILSSVPNVPTISIAYLADAQQRQEHINQTKLQQQKQQSPTHKQTRTVQSKFKRKHSRPNLSNGQFPELFAGIASIQQIIQLTEQTAHKHQEKENRKNRQKERKNQARRKRITTIDNIQ